MHPVRPVSRIEQYKKEQDREAQPCPCLALEKEHKENNLADESLGRDELIDAMLKFPRLIERPIVVKNGKAAIGRPIQNVIDIL